ncbi:MAG TPA: efflux transporter outer membrane subunit [Candidatus Eisenbacteria bacterium]|nr:efflux transporter outer membrane subunit [Candidatus Eisenbacteria bacterium]
MMKFRALRPALLALALAGCAVGPDYHEPSVKLPSRWSEAPADSEPALETPSRWWTVFADPELDSLIDRAVRANLDVQSAEARVREARAERTIAAAPFWPQATASGEYTRSKQSVNAAGGSGPSGSAGARSFGPSNLYQANFDATWEIDVFGGTRRSVEAASADIDASIDDRGAVLLTLLGDVARNYIELRGFQRQLEVSRSNLAAQKDTLDLTQARYQGGVAADLDVAQAEAQLETTASNIPTLEISAAQAVHRLGVLLGESPGTLADELSESRPIPAAPSELPPGLPSDLLRQRPDVRRSERQLAAATANIGVATADLYPKFSLLGTAGLSSISASDFLGGGSKLWSIGPSITWPVFQGGQIVANIEVSDAQAQQALLAYRQTILIALEDVENAIVEFSQERDRREKLAEAAKSNQRAVDHATALYTRGLTNFLNVLDAQRNLYQTESDLAQSETSVSTDLVALHKALGGGWDVFPMP